MHHEIIAAQNKIDKNFYGSIYEKMDEIKAIQYDIHALQNTISNLRRKSKSDNKTLDLSDIKDSLANAKNIFEELKIAHPNLFDKNESLLSDDADLSKVNIEEVEEMIEKIAHIVTQKQNKIPEVTQLLKLATDLNEILTKIVQETSKTYIRSFKTIIDNQVRG